MDKATEKELYDLAAYAQLNGLDCALKWLMREMQDPKPRLRRKVRVRLKSGGEFFMERERLGGSVATPSPDDAPAPQA